MHARVIWPLLTSLGLAVALTGGSVPVPAAGGAPPARLGLERFGPLELGMTRTDAVATGWLARRGTGCPLGGTPPITYRVSGPKAPAGVAGSAEFAKGRLSSLSFTRGVSTVTGVRVGRTLPARMAERYRRAGFAVRTDAVATFGGTFVRVRRSGRDVLGAFAETGKPITVLAIPYVPTCE